MSIKTRLAALLPEQRERVRKLVKDHGDVQVGGVDIAQVYGGMRDVKGLVSDISYVDPVEGIRFRGYTIPEVLERLPKLPGAEMPLVGGLYYLLILGEIPTLEEAQEVENEWRSRSEVPDQVWRVIQAMPDGTHPMTIFSQAVLALQPQSVFARKHQDGMKKEDYWEPMLEDCLDLTAKLPVIAARIYALKYKNNNFIQPDPNLDWGANFAHQMGIEKTNYRDLARLYFIIHSDHELGNVSAHATHMVGSTLADVYYAFSAGLNGLAGPLHGLASQEGLGWLLDVHRQFGGVPSREDLRQFAWDTLNSGQVIPGYGHAVLRKTDPRFTAQLEFARRHMPEDEVFQLANMIYDVVPEVLKEQGKARNPWPNVDAISGALQQHYGIREFDFLTVMFGVGRSLGVTANLVWARALGQPIERPKSLTTQMLEEIAQKAAP